MWTALPFPFPFPLNVPLVNVASVPLLTGFIKLLKFVLSW